MSRFGSLFRRAPSGPRPDAEAIARIKDWARASLAAQEDVAFVVNEIACTDPACPGVETVILAMAPGRRTAAAKIGKTLDAVTEQDVRAALSETKP